MTELAPARIPIFVLTGFLGSGKTSLLNALLKHAEFRDTAVIVNEFGQIGLDHLLIASAKENTVLLEAGCLCCTVADSLKETLADLYNRRARNDLPPFRRVMIETTGLADPGPILQQLVRDPLISYFYRLRGLICTVDAIFGEDQLAAHAEAAAQVAIADWLIVTKSDLIGDAWSRSLTRLLRSLNTSAAIHRGARGALDSRMLMTTEASDSTTLPWLGDIRGDHGNDGNDSHDHSISSQSYWLDSPVTWAGIAAWTELQRSRLGANLLRCKGILNVAGLGQPVILHGVRDRFETTRLKTWPDAERRSRLVVIGRNLDQRTQRADLGWLYAEEGTQPPDFSAASTSVMPVTDVGTLHAI